MFFKDEFSVFCLLVESFFSRFNFANSILRLFIFSGHFPFLLLVFTFGFIFEDSSHELIMRLVICSACMLIRFFISFFGILFLVFSSGNLISFTCFFRRFLYRLVLVFLFSLVFFSYSVSDLFVRSISNLISSWSEWDLPFNIFQLRIFGACSFVSVRSMVE